MPATTGRPLALRLLAAGGLVAIALIHLLDLPSQLDGTPYLGVLYILGPIITSLLAAALIVGSRSRIGWLLAGALAAATAIGYCLSRTTGLPNANDDIGNWSEPLGVASLVAEGLVVLLAVGYLVTSRRPAPATQSPRFSTSVYSVGHGQRRKWMRDRLAPAATTDNRGTSPMFE